MSVMIIAHKSRAMANTPHPAALAQLAVCGAVQEEKVSVKPPPVIAPFQNDGDASRDDGGDDDDPRSQGRAWACQAPAWDLTLACCAGSGLRQTASPPASKHKFKQYLLDKLRPGRDLPPTSDASNVKTHGVKRHLAGT